MWLVLCLLLAGPPGLCGHLARIENLHTFQGRVQFCLENGHITGDVWYKEPCTFRVTAGGYDVLVRNDSAWVYFEADNFAVLGKPSVQFARLLTGLDLDSASQIDVWQYHRLPGQDIPMVPTGITWHGIEMELSKITFNNPAFPDSCLRLPFGKGVDLIDLW